MIAAKKQLIRREIEEGTGASIAVSVEDGGRRTALKIWFSDLDVKHGPVADIRPHGLKSHRVELTFGDYAGLVIQRMQNADADDIRLARALVASIDRDVALSIQGQNLEEWMVVNGGFRLEATIRHEGRQDDDEAVIRACREIIVPVMAAMAELIGYEVIEEDDGHNDPAVEGAVQKSVINRRERNPRNRLLCLRVHGERCLACGIEPTRRYGDAGGIIEVHHLEPLALLKKPRPYDPVSDLVPLCPCCHRAVHTRHPMPWSIEDLQSMMKA